MTKSASERIALLDIVRGIAVLGILLMNIRLFSEPYAAYFNPKVFGSYDGWDATWFHFQFIVADQKFMAIFSMLFGASTAIICDGLSRRGEPVTLTFAKRNIGLLLIGLVHAHLLWHGDILVPYALTSIIPFLMRNLPWQAIGLAGIAFLAYGTYSSYAAFAALSEAPAHIVAAYESAIWHPDNDALATEVAAFTGGWLTQMPYRTAIAFDFETETYLAWGLWRIAGLMLIGLALYRSGFLKGKLAPRTYGLLAALCLPLGWGLAYTGLSANINAEWSFPYSMFAGNIWNYWGSLIVAIGYMAIVGFLLTATNFRLGFTSFANVGKAALTNYLFQTVVCTLIFYGHGLGLFGEVTRAATIPVVLGVWGTQLALSNWWFSTRDKGPIEALWNRFTYARWIPTRSIKTS